MKKFIAVILAPFIIVAAIMLIGYLKQEMRDKKEIARYEMLVDEEGKYKLTKDVLEEDYDRYLNGVKENEKFPRNIGIVIAGIVSLFLIFLLAIFLYIKFPFPDKKGIRVTGIALVIVGVIVVFNVNFLSELFRDSKEGSANIENTKYAFYELDIISARVEARRERSGSDDDSYTTNYYYYLYTNNRGIIEINQMYYNRAKDKPGIYYAGMTEKGALFSLYPATEFELAN